MFIPIPLFLYVHSQCFLFILYCFSLSFAHFLDSTLFLFFTVWTLLCSLISLSGIYVVPFLYCLDSMYFVHLSPFLVSTLFLFSQSGLYFVKLSYSTLWTLQYFVPCRLCLYSTLFIYLTFWTLLFFFPSLSGLSFVHLSYFVDSTFFFFSLSGHYFVHLFCYRIRIMNAVSWAGTC